MMNTKHRGLGRGLESLIPLPTDRRESGVPQLVAVDLSPEPVPDELANDCLWLGLGVRLELVERLDCRQPGDAASPATAALIVLAGGRDGHSPFSARRRFSSTIARQARAAAPPWSRPSGEARANAWASFSTVRMP